MMSLWSLLSMPSLLPMQWLLACAGSVAAGLAAWLLLRGAARVWPALRTQRGVWLAAQGMVAAAALLPFAPHPAPLHLVPQIDLGSPAIAATDAAIDVGAPPAASTEGAPASTAVADAAKPAKVAADRPPIAASSVVTRALPLLAAVWLLIYTSGLTCATLRQWQARRLLRGLLAGAQHLSPADLQAHGAFTASQLREIAQHRLTVLRTEAAISPMLIGVRRPHLLLPAHLESLSSTQQQMIIAHELHHWRVLDPLCLAIAAALQTIFWFNPPLRWMAGQMEWALELNCDQHVLAGRPQHQRKQYAASLLQQWTAMAPIGVAAFNGATITARIRHMQKDSLPTLSNAAAWISGAGLTAVLTVSALLQPALAFNIKPQQASRTPGTMSTKAETAAPAEAWRAPLDKVRVTSFFGVMRSVLPTPHKGIDFAAAKGTPVHAVASGTIIAAGPIAENDGRYGNVVIIDHGAQRSLLAHLDSVSVQAGQHVQAGALIGATGQTGFATGPHLHMEVRQNGQNIDPASMYPDLDAYATPRALKVRRQQLPSKG
jgi:murein DD-endopeptidase MepM/ murein hydrolase activator NlpD